MLYSIFFTISTSMVLPVYGYTEKWMNDSYDTGTALRKWANLNKVFKIFTVESIRE
jgi:hypothetical protein